MTFYLFMMSTVGGDNIKKFQFPFKLKHQLLIGFYEPILKLNNYKGGKNE